MTQRFGKFPIYLGNGLDTWGTASVFEKRLPCVGNDFNMWEMTYVCGKWVKYLRNG